MLPVTPAVIAAIINPSMLKRGECEPPRPPAVNKKKEDGASIGGPTVCRSLPLSPLSYPSPCLND